VVGKQLGIKGKLFRMYCCISIIIEKYSMAPVETIMDGMGRNLSGIPSRRLGGTYEDNTDTAR